LSDNPIITAIIPVRLSTDRLYDEPERIARIIATLPASYVPLIVDYGTPEERAGELSDLARATGTKLVRVETGEEAFSVGHARDIGTQHAATPLILYHDIDFLMSPRSYERVLEEARLRGMSDNAYAFFALPGAYLTEDFTRQYLALFAKGDAAFGDTLLHDGVLRRDKSIYENHTYAISAIVASRYHLLAIGGHDKSFVGHGAEDFELLHRLASYTPRGPKTLNYYHNAMRNSIQKYEGFRAYFALYGIDVFQRGLQVAHLWHPRRQDANYIAPKTDNQNRVSEVMADYDAGRSWLQPLEDANSCERTLFLMKEENTPPVRALRHIFPALGHYKLRREADFPNIDALLQTMDEEGFTRIFFLNPYGNPHRLALYLGVKAAGRRFIVWDRGGLNTSWFFDPNGFLAESSSYGVDQWDKPLDPHKAQKVQEWLEEHRTGATLEANGERVGAEVLRGRLNLGDRKIVFAALQRPNDTATVHFAGACGDAEGFNTWLSYLAETLNPAEYAIVAKKHPLEEAKPDIFNVEFVDGQTHVMDLIDLAECVVVINSGVGLLALSQGKPVICCGEAYYAQLGLATSVSSQEALVAAVRSPPRPDDEKRLRFFNYLIHEFYSFGKAKYVARKIQKPGLNRQVRDIRFSVVRGLTPNEIRLGRPAKRVRTDAPLYYAYGGKKAVEFATTSLKDIVEGARLARANAQYDEAIRLFELAREREPTKEEFSRQIRELGVQRYGGHLEQVMCTPLSSMKKLAGDAFAAGDYVRAAQIFEQLRLREPQNTRHLRCLAECYLLCDSRKQAEQNLEAALSLSPGNTSIQRRLEEIRLPWWKRPFKKSKPFEVIKGAG
jgi:predicted glycosyltransferase involved in capsule biosynthesis/tetratricopeptide (TPR) repeat protein